jgi:uncharacterized damage-inducible protein DinB
MASDAGGGGVGGLTVLARLWEESWGVGIWCAPWEKAVAGLAPEQAAWAPGIGRHSIWQNVAHVCVWREFTLTKVDGRPGPRREEMDGLNFAQPEAVNLEAWKTLVARLRRTHQDIGAALSNVGSTSPGRIEPGSDAAERLAYHLGHDMYHLGQIMQLRAALGMAPIE